MIVLMHNFLVNVIRICKGWLGQVLQVPMSFSCPNHSHNPCKDIGEDGVCLDDCETCSFPDECTLWR